MRTILDRFSGAILATAVYAGVLLCVFNVAVHITGGAA